MSGARSAFGERGMAHDSQVTGEAGAVSLRLSSGSLRDGLHLIAQQHIQPVSVSVEICRHLDVVDAGRDGASALKDHRLAVVQKALSLPCHPAPAHRGQVIVAASAAPDDQGQQCKDDCKRYGEWRDGPQAGEGAEEGVERRVGHRRGSGALCPRLSDPGANGESQVRGHDFPFAPTRARTALVIQGATGDYAISG